MNVADHPLYNTWKKMRHRCGNPYHHKYKDYGARGIQVHPSWQDDFWQFVADVGERPSPSHTLDRIDTNGNYEPVNTKWSTQKEQQRNRRDNVWATMNGQTLLVQDWAKVFGLIPSSLHARLRAGWGIEAALYMPPYVRRETFQRRLAEAWQPYLDVYNS